MIYLRIRVKAYVIFLIFQYSIHVYIYYACYLLQKLYELTREYKSIQINKHDATNYLQLDFRLLMQQVQNFNHRCEFSINWFYYI